MELQNSMTNKGFNTDNSHLPNSSKHNRTPDKSPLNCFDNYMGGKLMEKNYLSKYKISTESIGAIMNRYRSFSSHKTMSPFDPIVTSGFNERTKESLQANSLQYAKENQYNVDSIKETRQTTNCNDNKSNGKKLKDGLCNDISKSVKSDQLAKIKQSNCHDVEQLLENKSLSYIPNSVSPLRGAHHFKYGLNDYQTSTFRQKYPFASNTNVTRMSNFRRPIISHDDRSAHTLYERYLGGAGDGRFGSKVDPFKEDIKSKMDPVACERRNRRWNSGENPSWQTCNNSQVADSQTRSPRECRPCGQTQDCHFDKHHEEDYCSSSCCEPSRKFRDANQSHDKKSQRHQRQSHYDQETSPDVCRRQIMAEIIDAISGWDRKRETPWRSRVIKKTKKIKRPKPRAKSCDSIDRGKNKSANSSPSRDLPMSKPTSNSKSRAPGKNSSYSKKRVESRESVILPEKSHIKSIKTKKRSNSQNTCAAKKNDQCCEANFCCNNDYAQGCYQTCCCCCCHMPKKTSYSPQCRQHPCQPEAMSCSRQHPCQPEATSCSPQCRQHPCQPEATSCPMLLPPYQPCVSAPGDAGSCVSNDVYMEKLMASTITEENPFGDRTNLRKRRSSSKSSSSRKAGDKKGAGMSAPNKGSASSKTVGKKSSQRDLNEKSKSTSKTRNIDKEPTKSSRTLVVPTATKSKTKSSSQRGHKPEYSETETNDESSNRQSPTRFGKTKSPSPRQQEYTSDTSISMKAPSPVIPVKSPSPKLGSSPRGQSPGDQRSPSPSGNFRPVGGGAFQPPGSCSPTTNVNGREEYNIVLSVPVDITDAEMRELLDSVSTLIRQKSAPTRRSSPPRARHPTVSCLYAVSVGEGADQTASNSAPVTLLRHNDHNDSASPRNHVQQVHIQPERRDEAYEYEILKESENIVSTCDMSLVKSKSFNVDLKARSPKVEFEDFDHCNSIVDETKTKAYTNKVRDSKGTAPIQVSIRKGKVHVSPFLSASSDDESPKTKSRKKCIKMKTLRNSRLTPWNDNFRTESIKLNANGNKAIVNLKTNNKLSVNTAEIRPFSPSKSQSSSSLTKLNRLDPSNSVSKNESIDKGNIFLTSNIYSTRRAIKAPESPFRQRSRSPFNACGNNINHHISSSDPCYSKADVANALRQTLGPDEPLTYSEEHLKTLNSTAPPTTAHHINESSISKPTSTSPNAKRELGNTVNSEAITPPNAIATPTTTPTEAPTTSAVDAPAGGGPPWWWARGPRASSSPRPRHANLSCCNANYPDEGADFRATIDQLDMSLGCGSYLASPPTPTSPASPASPASTITRMLLELPPPPPDETFDIQKEFQIDTPKFCLSSRINHDNDVISTPVATPSPPRNQARFHDQNKYAFVQTYSASPLAPANINSSYSIDSLKSFEYHEQSFTTDIDNQYSAGNFAYSNACNSCSKSRNKFSRYEFGLKNLIKSQKQKCNALNCKRNSEIIKELSIKDFATLRPELSHTPKWPLENSLDLSRDGDSVNMNNSNLVFPIELEDSDNMFITLDVTQYHFYGRLY